MSVSTNILSENSENNKPMKYLVAISYTQQSSKLLEMAKELATVSAAEIQAVYVENNKILSKQQQLQLDKNISKAKELGIIVRIVTNYDLSKGISSFAIQENVSHIIIGKPKDRSLLSRLRGSNFIYNLIAQSENISVIVLGDKQYRDKNFKNKLFSPSFSSALNEYIVSSLVIAITAIACFMLKDLAGYRVLSFVLLFAVSILAFFFGTGPVLVAATLSALIWNFLFIPPHFTFHIDNTEDMLMFVMFFIIALLNGVLTSRIRVQETNIRKREERTHALYTLTKELSEASSSDAVKLITVVGIENYFGLKTTVLLEDEIGRPMYGFNDTDVKCIEYCFANSVRVGKLQTLFPENKYAYFPLSGTKSNSGVLVVELNRKFTYGEEQFWDAYIGQIAAKLDREKLRKIVQKSLLLDESDKLYKTLFNSISHEFRIPVTTIMGATDTLLVEKYPEHIQQKLITEINIASIRLNQLIENLLNMSRLESGHLALYKDWYDVHDLINKVVVNLEQQLKPYDLQVYIGEDALPAYFDFGLMEQVIHNLLLNATQYTPEGKRIEIRVSPVENNCLFININDNGVGFPEDELSSVFDKFFRGKSSRTGGTGLGLSIARGFIEAHNGFISVKNREQGGASFSIQIPVNG